MRNAQRTTFRFKKGPRPTGLSAIAKPYPDTDIKRGGKRVGMISAPSRFGHKNWRVLFVVKREPTETDPCDWRWARMRGDHETEQVARDWIMANADRILSELNLATLDDEE